MSKDYNYRENKQLPHVLYGKLSDKELTDKIKYLSSQRSHRTSGRDLVEMKQELSRRREERIVNSRIRAYNKKIKNNIEVSEEEKNKMLERPEQGRRFKKGEFIAGMSPKQEKFCMEYISTGDSFVAYKAAGYADGKDDNETRNRATRVLANPKIKQRIADLRDEAIDRMA